MKESGPTTQLSYSQVIAIWRIVNLMKESFDETVIIFHSISYLTNNQFNERKCQQKKLSYSQVLEITTHFFARNIALYSPDRWQNSWIFNQITTTSTMIIWLEPNYDMYRIRRLLHRSNDTLWPELENKLSLNSPTYIMRMSIFQHTKKLHFKSYDLNKD